MAPRIIGLEHLEWMRTKYGVILVIITCLLVQVVSLHRLLFSHQIEEDEFRVGYFEEFEGEIALITDIQPEIRMLPDVMLLEDRYLQMPPGNVILLPVEGDAYRIWVSSEERPPYIVLGMEEPVPSYQAQSHGETRFPARFRHGLVPTIVDGALVLRAWNPAVSWEVDGARLSRIAEHCGGATTMEVRHRPGAETTEVHIGSCVVETRLDRPGLSGAAVRLAILAGPGWTNVENDARMWRRTRSLRSSVLLVVISLVAMAQVVGLGSLLAVAGQLVVLGISFLSSGIAVLVYVLLGLLGLGGTFYRVFTRSSRHKITWRWARAVTYCSFIVLAALVWRMAADDEETGSEPAVCPESGSLLLGYSNVKGVSLRPNAPTPRDILATTCPALAGQVETHASPGRSFGWIRDSLCDGAATPCLGSRRIFLGGNNDDLIWTSGDMSRWFRNGAMILKLMLTQHELKETTFAEIFREAEAASMDAISDQIEVLGEALDCATANGAPLGYVHNFLAMDLASGRSPARTEALRLRREAVEARGGEFVDLLEEFGPKIGVSWFNDFIHFSDVGHRHVARTLCRIPIDGPKAERNCPQFCPLAFRSSKAE